MAKLSTSQIISRITKDCNFSQGEENDGSRYLELGILTVRISNHCTHLWTWHEKYGELFPKSMVSLVFDGGESEPQPILKRPSNVKFTVMEYVYPSELSINDVMLIIKEINAYKQTYIDPLGIIQKPNPITSVNPSIDIEVGHWDNSSRKIIYSDNMFGGKYKNEIEAKAVIKNYCQSHPINNKMPIPVYSVIYNCPDKPRVIIASYVQFGNKEIQKNNMQSARIKPLYESKTYKNMKKNIQRINESQLRAIVAESVKKVLREGYGEFEADSTAMKSHLINGLSEIGAAINEAKKSSDVYESDMGFLNEIYNRLDEYLEDKGWSQPIENVSKLYPSAVN